MQLKMKPNRIPIVGYPPADTSSEYTTNLMFITTELNPEYRFMDILLTEKQARELYHDLHAYLLNLEKSIKPL